MMDRDHLEDVDILQVKRIERTAWLPTRAHADDAGLDIRAYIFSRQHILEGGESHLFRTGIAVAIPKGHVGLLCPRSGLSKGGISIVNTPGVIDSGYTGEIRVNLINHSTRARLFKHADRIAQLLVVPVALPVVLEVGSLDATERGDRGHGSTGLR